MQADIDFAFLFGDFASPKAHDGESVARGHNTLGAGGLEKTDILQANFFKAGPDYSRFGINKRGGFGKPPRIGKVECGRLKVEGKKFMSFEIGIIRLGRWKSCNRQVRDFFVGWPP